MVAILATALLVSIQGPATTEAHAPSIDRFLYALGQVESGGNYTALNSSSGAYGKYQIMPYNWGPWASKYLGDAGAPQTPHNQEVVARGKVHDLYHWLGRWSRTAYWWLTGSSKTSGWTDYATRYVEKVMAIYRAQATVESPTTDVRRYSENSARIEYAGTWVSADHPDYRGGSVRQAKRAGQTATFTFSGSQVAWNGPKGPTRGKAHVFIDGDYVKTIDLYRSRFAARNRLFTRAFSGPGAHTLTIKVLGTSGRPVVAIDEFLVWD
jgi:hypothetical protein